MRLWLTGLIQALAVMTVALMGAAHAAPAEPPTGDGKPPKVAYLSLIIDDLGQSPEKDSRALALPGPVTLAIMPDTPHACDFARQAHKAGKTVILHMPMDPATGPYAWHPELPLPELESRLNAALLKVPYAAGINNHMGSRMTAEPVAMTWLVSELQRRHLFLVDSRTSAKTVAAAEAQKIGLASVSRDVFLDDERTAEAINGQLQTAIRLAHKQGSAVMIGHPYPVTMDVLERELPKLKSQGIEWVELRHMISIRGNQAMAGHGKNGVYR
nr:divergent polysaccharide deacetylase family protein [Pseudomonas sp. LP_7_YM]